MTYRTEDEQALLKEFLAWLTNAEIRTGDGVDTFDASPDEQKRLVAEFMKDREIR